MGTGKMVSAGALVVLLAACGSGGDAPAAVGTRANPGEPMHSLTVFHGINALSNVSQLAVVGTVTEIGEPITVAYPKPHDPALRPTYVDRTIRDVKVRVERVVFDSANATAAAGETVTVTIEPTGEPSRTASGCEIRANEVAGPLAVGDRRFMLLRRYTGFPTADGGTRDIFAFNGGWQAHWLLDGEIARSKCDRRSVPFTALLNRIESERRAGRNPARDPGTEQNPIAPARPD